MRLEAFGLKKLARFSKLRDSLERFVIIVAEMMGDAVEDVLDHHCLHANLYHMEEGKQRPVETGVNPSLSIIVAR